MAEPKKKRDYPMRSMTQIWSANPDQRKKAAKPKPREKYPRIRIGCLNTKAHGVNGYKAVHFVIPSGSPTGKCPVCQRRAGRAE